MLPPYSDRLVDVQTWRFGDERHFRPQVEAAPMARRVTAL